MNTNWSKILLFSLLSFALGFLVAHCCARHCGHHGGCDKDGMECHGKSMCDHGGGCCSEGGHCDKADCDHKMGGACCHGQMGGHQGCMMHGDMKGGCCKMGMGEDDKVHVIIDGLKEKNFQGDTIITIDGGTVNVSRHGDKMEVKVEMRDNMKVEEKTVEVQAH